MKPTIINLQESFRYAYDVYDSSRCEADMIYDLFHNEHYTGEQAEELRAAGRPVETFNVIRMFTRQLLGYYAMVTNTATARPTTPAAVDVCTIYNKILARLDYVNNVNTLNEELRQDLILSGLMVKKITVVQDGDKVDEFGRPVYTLVETYVPSREVVLDPASTAVDYSDSRFIHTYKWVPHEIAVAQFGKQKVDKLEENTAVSPAIDDNSRRFDLYFSGTIKEISDYYMIVHSVIKDKDKVYSVYWSNDVMLQKTEITNSIIKSPYVVCKLQDSQKPRYYGVMHDVAESQIAINQALVAIQLGVNSKKVIIRSGAVRDEDREDFEKAVVRVNAVLELDNPADVSILDMGSDIAQQYMIVDRAFERIQKVLGINDSFLGMAFASDSGRKVKLQQNATIMGIRYLDVKFNMFFKLSAELRVQYIQQYYRASDTMLDQTGNDEDKHDWVEMNKPLVHPVTNRYVYAPEVDPITGKPLEDKFGNILQTPLQDPKTDLSQYIPEIEFVATPYNDDDEKNQLLLETMLSGPIGQSLQQFNPAGYMTAGALVVRSMKSKYSQPIAKILTDTANMIQGGGQPQMPAQPQMNGGMSKGLKLPQNTNEEM